MLKNIFAAFVMGRLLSLRNHGVA